MVFGDHVALELVGAPLIRLNEFTVGFVSEHSASAWCSTPPMNSYATRERPSSPLASRNRFWPFASHSETCTWQPLPESCGNGFGMKVARSPRDSASVFTMYLKNA